MGVTVDRSIPSEKKPAPPPPPSSSEKMARLQELIAGKADPSNEMVAYLVNKARIVWAESSEVRTALQNNRENLERLEARSRELQGMRVKYIEDIEHWDCKAVPAKEKAA